METVNIYTHEKQPKFVYYHVDTEENEVSEMRGLELSPPRLVNNYLLISVHKNTGLSSGSFYVSEQEFRDDYTFLDSKTF